MLHLGVVRLGPPPPPPPPPSQAAPRDPRPNSGGSLRSFASEPLCVSLLLRRCLLASPQLDALEFLHENEYVHGNVTAENIFVNPEDLCQVIARSSSILGALWAQDLTCLKTCVYFTMLIADKELLSITYKEFLQINKKR